MDDFDKLRLKETDFITKGIIGQGHFGEVHVDYHLYRTMMYMYVYMYM